ncbi:ABSCISIC ACID-INSENSITIVE 5-like protein 4 isoform X1 [Olea europaea var. sylvestris]|uniref:ABSCISIC ACID-INSENSITIVE 5-like protein 4 isoform X1 n=1 Tax=Olea europaea var. sylvestris TaxID=158386 RepID=UPI000C1D6201|nr:ABSCISIC ACID-INSENSITIVE 5-like protein 4 isoform X1 [Olea europaea var. sylvestris]
MASSKVMASTSPPNPDLPRQTSPTSSSLHSIADQTRNFGSMSMEEILKNIYCDPDSFVVENNGVGGGDAVADGGNAGGGMRNGSGDGNKTVDEVWREIVIGDGNGGQEPEMTLEDFLTKAGAVGEEHVRVPVATIGPLPPVLPATAAFGVDESMNSMVGVEAAGQFSPSVCIRNGSTGGGYGVEFGNGMVAVGRRGGGNGRGKRRAALEDVVLDKATQQKQRRMIKNRESAARSRERKQAYTVELETLVTRLEEENATLLREEAEQSRKRYKQLMENLIPVVEGKRPPRILRRVRSMNF